ncbi:MAG TPA: tetratricopeptide repeat protein [Candidatus Acidoferrum sp.]|nr:tetratricopeptide repeat protein [Candidatus Acidoferrum sp.]
MYELPMRVSLLEPPFLTAALPVVGITIALVAVRRRWPAGLAVWLAYALTLAPVSGLVHAGLALLRAGRTADALPYLERAVALQGDDVDAVTNLGLALLDVGRAADAVPLLERGAPRRRSHGRAWLTRTGAGPRRPL